MSSGAARHDERAPFSDGVISQSEAQMLAKRLTDAKERIEELEEEKERLEYRLYVTQVALENLVSAAEQIPEEHIAKEDHDASLIWTGNINQARKVLPEERRSGDGEYGGLTERQINALDRAEENQNE